MVTMGMVQRVRYSSEMLYLDCKDLRTVKVFLYYLFFYFFIFLFSFSFLSCLFFSFSFFFLLCN